MYRAKRRSVLGLSAEEMKTATGTSAQTFLFNVLLYPRGSWMWIWLLQSDLAMIRGVSGIVLVADLL